MPVGACRLAQNTLSVAVLSSDTQLEAERVLVRLWRAQSGERKLEGWLALQHSCWEGLWRRVAGGQERCQFWRRWYGTGEIAPQEFLSRTSRLTFVDPLLIAEQVSLVLTRLGRRSMVVGSVASAFYGEIRQTQDVDFLVELERADIGPLMVELAEEFYLSESAAQEAVQRKSSFNLIHFASSTKVDLFVTRNRPFERSRFERARSLRGLLQVSSPEDVVLAKLEWYLSSRGILEKQWRDILGILAVCSDLDLDYLQHWAKELGVVSHLERALLEADPLR